MVTRSVKRVISAARRERRDGGGHRGGDDPDNPAWGHQLLTAVTREHRGHRLGVLVKTAMLDWLAVTEPTIERIVTGNAAINRHMIAINEELGYELLSPPTQSYELPVGDARG